MNKQYFDLAKDSDKHSLYFCGTKEELEHYKQTGEHEVIAEDKSFWHEWPRSVGAIIGAKKRRKK